MKILIIRLSAIGDVIHVLPSINLLRHYFINDHISWVICDKASDLIDTNPLINKVYRVSNNFPNSIVSDYKTIRELSKIDWDIIIDYHLILKSFILKLFLKGPVYTYSYEDCYRLEEKISYCLSTHNVGKIYAENKIVRNIRLTEYVIKKYKNLLNITYDLDIKRFKIYKFSNKGTDWLINNNILDFVTICVNCCGKSRMWKKEKWISLINLLIKSNINIVLLGLDYSEDGLYLKNKFINNNNVKISPPLSLTESCHILEKTKLLIAIDSSILHLSNYISTKTLGLFGPTCAIYNGSYYPNFNYIQSPSSKNFINHKNLKDNKCINDITANNVFDIILTLI
uniref:Uncharacterized protein n=1 Tax=viral metagenome TaxID=1070528 RepID=A0A6C0EJG7_9ZZZZ